MGKAAPNSFFDDGSLAQVALADEMWICSAEPANYAGIAAVALAGPITLTPGAGNGDFTLADGDTSGRKLTVGAQSGTVATSGTGNHVALATGGATDVLRYVTTFTGQALTATNPLNTGAFKVEIADPA
jgi:hypothetical protein